MKRLLICGAAALMLGILPGVASARSRFFLGLNFNIPLFDSGYRAPAYCPPPVVYAPAPQVYAPAPTQYYAPAPQYYAPAPAANYYAPPAQYCPPPVTYYAPAPTYYAPPVYSYAPAYGPRYYGGISFGFGNGYYHGDRDDFRGREREGGGYRYRH